ncbi:MAG: hypothetical protein A2Z88_04975 [Omnitrophica WOR_2 bacterium GWA2_47_8]|nr:MAG: hypothetical protein A2Z88_04975 [Omnitrophica WOR_2 bacterium GWA2_47_8]
MKTDYSNYIDFYKHFSTSNGYYEACDYLSFQNDRWQGMDKYIDLIGCAISDTKKRLSEDKILMADIGCGAYSWLQRYFFKSASKIICIDSNKDALNQIELFKNPLVETIQDNAFSLEKIFSLGHEFDFIYCGFNVYEGFVDNFLKLTAPGGCIFLMKPKIGDDLILRSLVRNYDILPRYKEIAKITADLEKNAEVKYREEMFSWKFENESTNKLLAAMSVVCLGEQVFMRREQYEIAVDFVKLRTSNNAVLMSQTFALWQAVRKNN